jgi:hypothetical protein
MDVIHHTEYGDHRPPWSDIHKIWPASPKSTDETEPAQDEFIFMLTPDDMIPITPPQRSAPLHTVSHPVTPDRDFLPTDVTVQFGHEEVRITFNTAALPAGVYATTSEDMFDTPSDQLRRALTALHEAIAAAYFPTWKPPSRV